MQEDNSAAPQADDDEDEESHSYITDSDIDFDMPTTAEGMAALTVKQLKTLCKANRVSGYSKYRKAELVDLLMQL